MDPEHHLTHGRSAYVTRRCRCDICTAANAEYQRTHWRSINRPDAPPRPPLVDADPTRRRILRMTTDGVSLNDIARRAELPRSTLADIAKGRSARTHRNVHDAVVWVYRSHAARTY
jgi:hypothetical protein